MSARYPGAVWLPSPHFGFPTGAHGTNTPLFITIHGTGYDPSQTAAGVARDFATTNPNSAHFAIDREGGVAQMVDVPDSAWANGVMTGSPGVARPGDDTSPHDNWWDALQAKYGNLNNCTVSIEHVNDSNNDLAPTPAQLAVSFALVAWLCRTYGIPARAADAAGGITGHYSIDPVARAFCPGNYPFAQLFAYLDGAVNMRPWTAPGAVAFSEFARDHTGDYKHATCVEAAALECAIAQHPAFRNAVGQPGDYLDQMIAVWQGYADGVSAQGASSYVDATRWLRGLGYQVDEDAFDPMDWWEVLVAGLEQHSVFLVGVNNAQALHGDEAGVQNHGLAALGIDGNGGIVCGDPDNAASQVNMPGSPWGTFVTYSKQDLANGGICSLTRVYPMAGIPTGWTDDGTTLTAPPTSQNGTGQPVRGGFRDYIMTEPWDAADQPLAAEVTVENGPLLEGNGTDGPGSTQVFRLTTLCWDAQRGVFRAWPGNAIAALRAELAAAKTAQPTAPVQPVGPVPTPQPAQPDPTPYQDAVAQIKAIVAPL